jgi:hypothetical protein
MTEGLFILTTIFVAYVVYQVVNDQKISGKSGAQEAVKKTVPDEPPKSQTVEAKEEPAVPKTASAESAAAAPSHPAGRAGGGLRDPKTGETSTAYTNYRFTKRWIKEALVAEGLLPKIYKNNELDADTEANIKAALAKLEAMDKYRA